MKKLIILATILFASFTAVQAESLLDGRISIDNVQFNIAGDNVNVRYTITTDRRAVKRGYSLLLSPYIGNSEYKQSLPAIVVDGRGTLISRQRGEWVSGLTEDSDNITYLKNGQSTTLTATVPMQEWMYGAHLSIEAAEGGCCSYTVLNEMQLGAMIPMKSKPQSVPAVAPEPEPQWQPVTVADDLSTAFTFVLPDSEFDAAEPFKIYDDERENALVVYFHVGKYNIVPEYLDNAYTLSNLINVIKMIMAANDSRVERVVVAGFASPEGGFELNDRLAFDRAVSVKEYIMRQTGLSDGSILLHNGSVDWRGLRVMVEKSNLPEKREILSIIDYTPVWDSRRQVGRLGELMRLNGGRTYRYLLNEYFPYLRSGAFIRVYYKNDNER
jgi:outer membrane protein OmpA-like peptidoglycan-associated protein